MISDHSFTEEEVEEIMINCYNNPMVFAKLFFPETFSREFSSLHTPIFEMLKKKPGDEGYKPKKAIIVPRGLGKTTIANMLIPAFKILFQEAKYIVPVSASSTLAEQQSENLKAQLFDNELIKELFGDISSNTLNKQQWVVNVGGEEDAEQICVMPRGGGQQIRGLNYRSSRPDFIVIDDLEDPKNMDSEDQRAKKKRWFMSDLLQCVDNYADEGTWEILMVGTVLHQDAIIVNIMDDPTWDVVELSICDQNFEPYAPEWADKEWILAKYNEFKEQHDIESFYREYMNMPSPGGKDAAFRPDMFKYYDTTQVNLDGNPKIVNVLLCDPARTAKMESADSAVVCVALDLTAQAIYVREIINGKFTPSEFYDVIFSRQMRYRAQAVGIEVTGLHEYITYPIKNEMSRRRQQFQLVELQARGGGDERGKVARIKTLIPFYQQGLIYHNKATCQVLESQLMSFPRAKYWDVMDALGYAPQMLELGMMYMLDGYEDFEVSDESEFRELDDYYDEPLDGFGIVSWN